MNIFDILNSQFVSQSVYDTILIQQKAFLTFLAAIDGNIPWAVVREAGILDLCYEYYRSTYILDDGRLRKREGDSVPRIGAPAARPRYG